jgi:DNA repair protein RadD
MDIFLMETNTYINMYTLRPYQEKGKQDCLAFINKKGGKRYGLAVAPTGSGKSLYIASIANTIQDKILVVQPSKELLEQNYDKYISYGNAASIFSASMGQKEVGQVTFATPLSLRGKEELFKDVKVILADEAHLFSKKSGVFATFINNLPKSIRIIGLTATPLELAQNLGIGPYLKMQNRSNKNIFQDIIHVTQIQDIVEQGYWAEIEYALYEQDQSGLKSNTTGSSYTEESLKKYIYKNGITNKIKSLVSNDYKDSPSILIFLPGIDNCKDLAANVSEVECVHSKTSKKERTRIVNGFKSGSIRVVVCPSLLSTGFDYPSLHVVIDAGPSMSISKVYQKWGRAVRPHPDKKHCTIVDMAGNYERFGDIRKLEFYDLPRWGWGMFSGEEILTNVPIEGKTLISELQLKPIPKIVDKSRMSFGQHTNMLISDLIKNERPYVEWLLNMEEFSWKGKKWLLNALKQGVGKVDEKVEGTITAFFDGSCAPGPGGNMGMGCFIMMDDEIIYEQSYFRPEAEINSSPRAESLSLYAVLHWLDKNNYHSHDVTIFGDNQTCIHQANRFWQIKAGKTTTDVMLGVLKLKEKFTNIKFQWIPREQNTHADVLSGRLLEEKNLIKKRR